jgi:hypothetical protein
MCLIRVLVGLGLGLNEALGIFVWRLLLCGASVVCQSAVSHVKCMPCVYIVGSPMLLHGRYAHMLEL